MGEEEELLFFSEGEELVFFLVEAMGQAIHILVLRLVLVAVYLIFVSLLHCCVNFAF